MSAVLSAATLDSTNFTMGWDTGETPLLSDNHFHDYLLQFQHAFHGILYFHFRKDTVVVKNLKESAYFYVIKSVRDSDNTLLALEWFIYWTADMSLSHKEQYNWRFSPEAVDEYLVWSDIQIIQITSNHFKSSDQRRTIDWFRL